MSAPAIPVARRTRIGLRSILAGLAGVILIAAMALDTKVVTLGAAGGAALPGVFVPAEYGKATFPKIESAIEAHAVDAATLVAALAKDPAAAAKQYGVASGTGTEFAVTFKGVVGKGDFGTYDVTVEGVPGPPKIQVQTGPAIMGTDLRDASGTISFGQFVNQIDYQNAGSALNKEMKKQVLSKIDASALTGKTIAVVGAFQMGDPSTWLVTPVKLTVQ